MRNTFCPTVKKLLLHRYCTVSEGSHPRRASVVVAGLQWENEVKKAQEENSAATTSKNWYAAIYYILVHGYRYTLMSCNVPRRLTAFH